MHSWIPIKNKKYKGLFVAGNGIVDKLCATELVLLRIGCQIKQSISLENACIGQMFSQCFVDEERIFNGQPWHVQK